MGCPSVPWAYHAMSTASQVFVVGVGASSDDSLPVFPSTFAVATTKEARQRLTLLSLAASKTATLTWMKENRVRHPAARSLS